MAAVSGALNARLEKPGYHVLGEKYHPPETLQINKAVFIVVFSSMVVLAGIYFIGKVPLIRF